MVFGPDKIAALIWMGGAAAQVDGQMNDKEKGFLAYELKAWKILEDEYSEYFWKFYELMDKEKATIYLSEMSQSEKRYIIGFLTAMMGIDGTITAVEHSWLYDLRWEFGIPASFTDSDAFSEWESYHHS